MKRRNYFISTLLMAIFVSPMLVNLGVFLGSLIASTLNMPNMYVLAEIVTSILIIVAFWAAYTKSFELPENALDRYLPIVLAFAYYMLNWIIAFGMSGYSYGNVQSGNTIFFLLMLPYIYTMIIFLFSNFVEIVPYIQIALFSVIFLTMFVSSIIIKKKTIFKRDFLILITACVVIIGVFGYQTRRRDEIYIAFEKGEEKISEEIDFSDYDPFAPGNILKSLDEESNLTIYSDYPRLDGATALYPVYAAMTQMVYPSLRVDTVYQYVTCSTTIYAFERLIDKEIDIFFGAQPSSEQQKKAREKGIELVMTPIAKDAFVFFVHKDNPIESLTIEQIQDIYTKKITNWKEVGGNDEPILAFQRPNDSGSQTIMLAKVMHGKPLPTPPMEEFSTGMGEIISDVANYRNTSSAIGYSFRFFATGMKPNDQLKLLAIDGVKPTIENIRSGEYTLTVNGYVITTGNESENTKKLIEWILSEQGQRLIEECGYVGIK